MMVRKSRCYGGVAPRCRLTGCVSGVALTHRLSTWTTCQPWSTANRIPSFSQRRNKPVSLFSGHGIPRARHSAGRRSIRQSALRDDSRRWCHPTGRGRCSGSERDCVGRPVAAETKGLGAHRPAMGYGHPRSLAPLWLELSPSAAFRFLITNHLDQ